MPAIAFLAGCRHSLFKSAGTAASRYKPSDGSKLADFPAMGTRRAAGSARALRRRAAGVAFLGPRRAALQQLLAWECASGGLLPALPKQWARCPPSAQGYPARTEIGRVTGYVSGKHFSEFISKEVGTRSSSRRPQLRVPQARSLLPSCRAPSGVVSPCCVIRAAGLAIQSFCRPFPVSVGTRELSRAAKTASGREPRGTHCGHSSDRCFPKKGGCLIITII